MHLPLFGRLAFLAFMGAPLLQGVGSLNLKELQEKCEDPTNTTLLSEARLLGKDTTQGTGSIDLSSRLVLGNVLRDKKKGAFLPSGGAPDRELCDWDFFVALVKELMRRSSGYEGVCSDELQLAYRNLLWSMNIANPTLMATAYEGVITQADSAQQDVTSAWGEAWILAQFGLASTYATEESHKLRAMHFRRHAQKTYAEVEELPKEEESMVAKATEAWVKHNREQYLGKPLFDRGSVPTAKGGGVLLCLTGMLGYGAYRLWHWHQHRYNRPYKLGEDTYFEEEEHHLQRGYEPLDL